MPRIFGLISLAISSLATTALAKSGDVVFAGWADKGRFFVLEGHGPDGDEPAWATVVDDRGTLATDYDLTDDKATLAYGAWKKAHPPAAADNHRDSPDGKAKADVAQTAKETKKGMDVRTDLWVERGGVKSLSQVWRGGAELVEPYWSPDGKRIAWVIYVDNPCEHYFNMAMGCMDPWQMKVLVGTAGGPRLHVLAGKQVKNKALPKVVEALEKAGLAPIVVGQAQEERDKSVVYAAKGREADGKAVAAAVPGGATVEPLTWNVDADVVVAVGKSALEGKP